MRFYGSFYVFTELNGEQSGTKKQCPEKCLP